MSDVVVVLLEDRERSVEWWPSSGLPAPAAAVEILAKLADHRERIEVVDDA